MNRSHTITFAAVLLLFIFAVVWKNTTLFSENEWIEVAEEQVNRQNDSKFWDYFNRAEKLRLEGNFSKAAGLYRSALEINREHEGTLYNLGNVHLFLKEFDEAEQYWQQLIRVNPSSARAWLQLGTLCFCREENNLLYNPRSARENFLKASDLNREETGPRLHLAKIAILNNDYSEAEEYLESVIAQNFMSYQAQFLKGYIEWKSGNPEKGLEHISEAGSLYVNLYQVTMQGEGATASGFNPMLSDAMYCDFIGIRIDCLLDKEGELDYDKMARLFNKDINQWKNEMADN